MKNPLVSLYNSKSSPDTALIVLGAIGWLVSMLAQLTAINTNPKITGDNKRFLLFQETADGLVNTSLYLGVTTICSNIVKKMVDSGKIITSKTKNELDELAKKSNKTFETLVNEVMQAPDTSKKSISQLLKNADEFTKFKNGLGLLTTIFASVLSCNIITPFARNAISNRLHQNTNIGKKPVNAPEKQPITQNFYPKNPTFNTFNNITKV